MKTAYPVKTVTQRGIGAASERIYNLCVADDIVAGYLRDGKACASARAIAVVINFFIFILQSGASRLLTRASARKLYLDPGAIMLENAPALPSPPRPLRPGHLQKILTHPADWMPSVTNVQ